MTYYLPTVLTVDTLVLFWSCNMHKLELTGWHYKKAKEKGKSDQFTKTINDTTLIYLPHWSTLMVSFSASKVANGCNIFPYQNSQYEILKDKIEKIIFDETKKKLHFEESYINRLDVNRDIVFPTIKDAKDFIKWAQKHIVVGGYQKNTYNDNGDYRRYKSGLVCKIYLKNDDPALPDEIKKNLPPTVRIEVECRNSMKRKILGQVRGDILKYPAVWQKFFNTTLEKFKLGGTILNFIDYKNTVASILQFENPTNRQSTIDKKVKMLLDSSRGNVASNRKKQEVGLINKIASYNINPFAFSKAELIPDGTLMADSVMSVEEQQLIEYNTKLFESVLKKKKEAKLCKKLLNKSIYLTVVKLLVTFTQKFFARVPVMDSS